MWSLSRYLWGGGGADWTQISKEFKFLIAFLFHEGKKIELRL